MEKVIDEQNSNGFNSNGTPASQPVIAVVKGCWEALWGRHLRFYAFVILFVLAYSIDLLTPWAIGYSLGVFVDKGLNADSLHQATLGIVLYTALKVANLLLHHLGRYLQITTAFSARMHTLNKLFGVLIQNPLPWHVAHQPGDSLSKLHRSAGAIESCIGTYVWQIIEGLVKITLAGLAIFTLDFWVAVNVLGLSAITIILMIFFNRRLRHEIRRNNAFADKLNRICVDHFFNVVTIKTLSLEDKARSQMSRLNDEGFYNTARIARISEMKWGSTGLGYSFVIGTSLLIYFHNQVMQGGHFDVAPVYLLINYLDRIFQAIGSFTAYYSGLIEATTAYEDASRIIADSEKVTAAAVRAPPIRSWERLCVRNLSFTYTGADNPGVQDATFQFKRGDKIAVVGPSGSGKSTLLKLLGGMLEPDSGTLETENEQGLPLAALARSIILIPQEPEIFAETLLYNLTLEEDFSKEELEHAVKLTYLAPVLARLKDDWNTDLASRGLNISVGEKQRIAMARGLLRAKNRSVILLDEPTSSLDPAAENEIFTQILRHFKDRTIITACHRLKIVPLFDQVMYVRGGRILEMGTFQDLVSKGGYFAAAWEDYQRMFVREAESV